MRVVRVVGAWATVVIAVVGWILFVPVFNVLGQFFDRLSRLAGVEPTRGREPSVERPGIDAEAVQPSHVKEHGKRAA